MDLLQVENPLLQRLLPKILIIPIWIRGAMYRAATYLALQNHLTENDVDEIVALLETYSISFGRSENGEQLVFVGDVDVTHPIRENEVTNNVSWVAAIPHDREK